MLKSLRSEMGSVGAAHEVESLSPHSSLSISGQQCKARVWSLVPLGRHACVFSVLGSALAPRAAHAWTRAPQGVHQSTPAWLPRAFRRGVRPVSVTRHICIRSGFIHCTAVSFLLAPVHNT